MILQLITRFVEMPNHRQIYDVDHIQIDETIHEASDRLNAFIRARYGFDRINEKYIRLRSRVEAERLPSYDNTSGTEVDFSGGGSNGADNAMVMLGNQATDARLHMMREQRAVTDLIHRACRINGKINYRLATALECRYAHFPPMPYEETPKEWPQYFRNRSSAQRAAIKAEAMVVQYVMEQRVAAASAI